MTKKQEPPMPPAPISNTKAALSCAEHCIKRIKLHTPAMQRWIVLMLDHSRELTDEEAGADE